MSHTNYILIYEMRFVGPKFFMKIDSCLWEAFSEKKDSPFSVRLMITVGDLGELTPFKDKILYGERTTWKFLWELFNIVVTLDKIYRQQGDDRRQTYFHNLLMNIGNA